MPIKKKYPPEYYAARPLVLERAGNRCENCPAENYKPHPVSGKLVRLQVHHLDGNIKNNELDNLRLLCAKCHGIFKKKSAKNRRTGNPPENRAKNGTFDSYKNVGEIKKSPHREPARKQGEDSLSKNDEIRVFIAKNKSKLKKGGLWGEFAQLAGGSPVRQNSDTGNPPANQAKTGSPGMTPVGDFAELAGGFPVEAEKRRKSERKKKVKDYQQKEERYEREREDKEAEKGEEPPKRKKRGRPSKQRHFPYYEPYSPVVMAYRANGTAYDPRTGKIYTSAEEAEIINGIVQERAISRKKAGES